jgi:hypothetical protein
MKPIERYIPGKKLDTLLAVYHFIGGRCENCGELLPKEKPVDYPFDDHNFLTKKLTALLKRGWLSEPGYIRIIEAINADLWQGSKASSLWNSGYWKTRKLIQKGDGTLIIKKLRTRNGETQKVRRIPKDAFNILLYSIASLLNNAGCKSDPFELIFSFFEENKIHSSQSLSLRKQFNRLRNNEENLKDVYQSYYEESARAKPNPNKGAKNRIIIFHAIPTWDSLLTL